MQIFKKLAYEFSFTEISTQKHNDVRVSNDKVTAITMSKSKNGKSEKIQ